MTKKYKNNILFVVITTLLFAALGFTNLKAAAHVYLSAPGSVTSGKEFTVTYNNGSNDHTFSGTLVVSGAATGSYGISLAAGQSQSVSITPTSTGTIYLSTDNGLQVAIAPPFNTENVSPSGTVQVVSPSTDNGSGNAGGGNTGGNTGGTNNGGDNGVYNPSVDPETEEEKQAREEREKAEQLERDKKIPLIESIEIISNDEKRNGKSLSTIETKEDTFEYSYGLPMFIEKVSLKVNGVDEDVKLTFDKDHEVKEDKEVVVTASKGEITQEFKLKLTASNSEDKKVEDGFIYEDEELTKAFKDLGFETKEYEKDGKKFSMFNKNDLNLQMIVDEQHEALFYQLDEKGNKLEKGQIVVFEKDLLFVVEEVDEEIKEKTLYSNKYESIELPKPAFLEEIDESLKMKQVSSGWKYDDGSVVVALNDKLEKDTYNIIAEQPFKAAVVAFDGQSSPTLVYALIGSLVALLAVSIGFVVYYLQSKKRIQALLNRNQI